MRNTAPRTASTPYIATWTGIGIDFTATTDAVAPVILPGILGVTYVNLVIAGASASKTFSWKLCLIDRTLGAGVPLRCIGFTSAATAHRTSANGAGSLYFHDDKIIDIGGINPQTPGGSYEWALALTGIDTDTGAYLLAATPARLQGSP